jgi:hypothetical protein
MDLLVDTIWIGIAPGSPGFTKGGIRDAPGKAHRANQGLSLVAKQGGMVEEAPEQPAGEGEAASQ